MCLARCSSSDVARLSTLFADSHYLLSVDTSHCTYLSQFLFLCLCPYSMTERRVPELIPVLGSQPAGDVSHKPDSRLPLLVARPAVTPAALKRAATNFAAW